MTRLPGYLLICCSLFSTAAAEEAKTDAVRITTKPAAELLFYPRNSAPASAESLNTSKLSAQISAQIQRIPVSIGQSVQQGSELVMLDCRDYQYRLDQAKAAKTFADKQYERGESLGQSGSLSLELRNQRQLEKDNATAEFRLASLAVQRCVIRAPFNGVVTGRLASEGDLAAAGTPIIELVDSSRLQVSAKLPSASAAQLPQASKLWFESNGQGYPVHLDYLSNAIDSLNRDREARLSFTDNKPIPGSAGRLYWESPQPHLPADLIVRRDGQLGVLLAKGSTAQFVALPGAREGQPAATTLDAKASIILNGRHSLSNGDAISLN